ncbi:MAG: DoxX family protein [Thermoguttaceae bacterium]|nr:DoxX family protein [Thermoguttaceae bacterium]MBR5759516.1 DoxX family protein [Thermoguttaceae bacterium]
MGKTKTCSCYAAVVIAIVVILRLGVGCHFLYEGLWKMNPDNGFSSKGFLGQAKGPTKEFYYMFLPDLGGEGRLKMAEVYKLEYDNQGNYVQGTKKRLGWTMPVFEKEWFKYFQAYVDKYGLTSEENAGQLKEASKIFNQYVLSLREYTLENREDIRGFVASKARFQKSLAMTKNNAEYQRIRDWDAQMKYRSEGEKFATEPETMGKNMQLALWDVLTPEQKSRGRMTAMAYGSNRNPLMRVVANLPFINRFAQPTTMGMLDLAVTLGLAAIGLCLILGFCTRLAALGGACFMFNVVLSQFPWPTVYPYPSDMIGHSMVCNKDSIEMMLLILLAVLPSGRWAGLDWFLWNCCGKFIYCWYGVKRDPLVPDCMNPECCEA